MIHQPVTTFLISAPMLRYIKEERRDIPFITGVPQK